MINVWNQGGRKVCLLAQEGGEVKTICEKERTTGKISDLRAFKKKKGWTIVHVTTNLNSGTEGV